MLAGWITAFRNRSYLGWLGAFFMSLSGYLIAYDSGQSARSVGLEPGGAVLAQKAFLVVCAIALVLAVVAAVRETLRRIREIQAGQRAAEEAMLAVMQASLEKEKETGQGGRADGDGE